MIIFFLIYPDNLCASVSKRKFLAKQSYYIAPSYLVKHFFFLPFLPYLRLGKTDLFCPSPPEILREGYCSRTTIVPVILSCQERLLGVNPTQRKPRKKGMAERA